MKKILTITSYLIVAIISGSVSIVSYNTLIKAKVIEDSEQLELRKKQMQLEFNKAQIELEAQEKINYLTHRKAIEDTRQRDREIELANRKASHAFTQ
jgi:cell division protein FtsL